MILAPDEIERAGRYHQEKDQLRFIISRGMLRLLLGKYLNQKPINIHLEIGANKKPFVQNRRGDDLHYNVSHSGDLILIAVSNSEVGIDIEKINDSFSYKEILPHNFSDEEILFIKKPEDFYLLWTRKEALLKATAKGIDDDLPLIPSLDGTHHVNSEIIGSEKNWNVNSFHIGDGYIGSVTKSCDKNAINFYDTQSLMQSDSL